MVNLALSLESKSLIRLDDFRFHQFVRRNFVRGFSGWRR